MAEQDFGVNITCLVDGCKITINPSYGFWRYLQDALSSTFPADSDAQDLAQAQMLRFYTEKLKEVSDGSVDYDTFISDIENSGYPFDNYILTQAQQQFENAQYNGFLNRIGAIFETGDGQAIQDFFDRYENSGIANNSFVVENSFSLMNPQNVLDRMILGDGDWGVTIQMCTSTVTTNCVDPKAINDIWEDFGRHIQVIFKGLEIPGLPEWLPLPGIMRLPTIGEIWDKVSGPFTDAAREQLKDCMSKDDDGDGVNNTASYCMENRDITGIITKGLEDGAGEIIDATTDAVGEIVDKALEGIDCVLNPADCAGKIKDVLEGVLGGADPTQPGLPPWMRAIIIGSQYGDEVLKELEKIFNEDIDGDGTIGIAPTQEYCADGVTVKEDAEGTNCPEYAEFGYCTDGTTKKQDSAGTNCPDYVPDYGMCDDGLTKKEDAEGTNCPGPEPVVNEGDPCTLENEGTGTYQYVGDELQCIPDPPEFGFCRDGVTEKEDAEGTNCDEYEGPDDGTYDPVCTEPRPTGRLTFELEEQQFAWDQKCRATHCESGVPISEDPDCYGPPPGETCDNNAVNPDDCNDCGDGTTPDQHINGDCNEDLKNIDGTEGQCPADSERAGQNPIYDSRDTNQSGFFTSSNGITYTYEPCNPSLGFSIVGQDVNVCEDQNNLNYGNIVQQPEEPCGDCKPGFDKPDGYDTCTSIVDVLCEDDNVSGNYEECGTAVDCSEITEDNYYECGKVKCPVGSIEKYVDNEGECRPSPADCTDPDSEPSPDGGCVCKEGFVVDPRTRQCLTPAEFCDKYPDEPECKPEVDCSEITEDNYKDCNKVKCPEGSETPYADSLDDCVAAPPPTCEENDPNSESDGQGGCKCKQGYAQDNDQDSPTFGKCVATKLPPEQCTNESGDPSGAVNYPDCNKCPEGQDFNEKGICDDIPVVTCEDPNATNYEQEGECGPCKDLYDKPEGYDECTLIETLCQDPDYAEGNELCQGPCDDGEVEFVAQNGEIFCDAPCAYNDQIASSSPDCVAPECRNGATDYPDCVTCPSGQRINPETDQCEEIDCTDPANALICGWVECDDGTMAPTLGDCEQETPCSDPTYAAANPLECGWVECPDGSFAETREDCEETPQECANGATDYPDCTVCPEGQSMDAEGNCTDCSDCSCAEYAAANPEECITQPPPLPPETGGGGGGMLGGGSFTPFLAGISYTPQAVPEPPAPAQKDYMAELDNLIKRSLFEGMA